MNTNANTIDEQNVTNEQSSSGEQTVKIDNSKRKNESEDTLSGEEQQVEIVGGIACPIDPMERLQCESCQ